MQPVTHGRGTEILASTDRTAGQLSDGMISWKARGEKSGFGERSRNFDISRLGGHWVTRLQQQPEQLTIVSRIRQQQNNRTQTPHDTQTSTPANINVLRQPTTPRDKSGRKYNSRFATLWWRVSGRPFVKRFVLCYQTVVLSVCLSVCLSVFLILPTVCPQYTNDTERSRRHLASAQATFC